VPALWGFLFVKKEKNIKIGRNDKCWCGSGRKFKKCHGAPGGIRPPPISEIILETRKQLRRKRCLHPSASKENCSGAIIEAHTVQRAQLEKIAEHGHVYGSQRDLGGLISDKGKLVFKKLGISDASVVPIFCEKHDAETFAPIEKSSIVTCNEHVFLLAYRSVCYEFSRSLAAIECAPIRRQLSCGQRPETQTDIEELQKALQIKFRQIKRVKDRFDSMLLEKNFSGVRYYCIRLKNTPDFMLNGCLFPDEDFNGNYLQDRSDATAMWDTITVNVLADGTDRGLIIFAWLSGGCGACEKFIQSLDEIGDVRLGDAITRYAFEYFENKYLKISWWDLLPPNIRQDLEKRGQMAVDLSVERPADCLVDNQIQAVDWRIAERIANF